MKNKVLEAAWILPINGPPLKNAGVAIAGTRIERILSPEKLQSVAEDGNYSRHYYGQAIIVPGFINLHTHLEYNALRSLSLQGGLFAWLPRLMEATSTWSLSDRLHSIQQGIEQVIATGTTFIVDNSYDGSSAKAIAHVGLRGLVGLEIFGVDEPASEGQWQRWIERYDAVIADTAVIRAQNEKRLDVTIAPHAPYTVCPALWRKAQNWADTNGQIILTHLAESLAECQWFGTEDEEVTEFLVYAFSKRDPNFTKMHKEKLVWKEGSRSPVEHLYKHNLLKNNLLAGHVVQVSDQDIELLKAEAVAVAHCPRSNTHLGCGQAPLGKMIANGLRVGLGTDSQASNDDLDLLSEARFATELHRLQLPHWQSQSRHVIECLTIKAAQCLNREHDLGSLEPGKLADIAVFGLPAENKDFDSVRDPYELLLRGDLKLRALFVDGREINMSISS